MSCAYYMYVFLSQRKVSTLLFFYMRNYHVRMGPGPSVVQNKKKCPASTSNFQETTTKKKPTPRYTHGTIKKKRAIVYYYVRIYTTANVSADTVEGDQQLLLLGQKAVKPTGKTTLVQFLFFFGQRCSTAHDLHHVHVFIFVEFTFLFGGGILVLLVLGDKIVHVGFGFGEFHFVHTFTGVPVKKGLTTEHGGELFGDTFEHFLDIYFYYFIPSFCVRKCEKVDIYQVYRSKIIRVQGYNTGRYDVNYTVLYVYPLNERLFVIFM